MVRIASAWRERRRCRQNIVSFRNASATTSSGRSKPPGWLYFIGLGLWSLAVLVLAHLRGLARQIEVGLGVAGLSNRRSCGPIYITNFVFWVGIAHSGTLDFARCLLLFRARWRTGCRTSLGGDDGVCGDDRGTVPDHPPGPSLVCSTGSFRTPNQRQLWVNFDRRSSGTSSRSARYLTVSALFLYLGLVPDIAAARDRIGDWRQRVYRFLALGWARHGPAVAALQQPLRSVRRAGHAAGACRSTAWSRGTSPWRSCPAGTARSSRRTS